jgi:hypothetical protein
MDHQHVRMHVNELYQIIKKENLTELEKYTCKYQVGNMDHYLIQTIPKENMNFVHLCCSMGNIGILDFVLNLNFMHYDQTDLINLRNKDGESCLMIGNRIHTFVFGFVVL